MPLPYNRGPSPCNADYTVYNRTITAFGCPPAPMGTSPQRGPHWDQSLIPQELSPYQNLLSVHRAGACLFAFGSFLCHLTLALNLTSVF